jgi:hypothetical protein
MSPTNRSRRRTRTGPDGTGASFHPETSGPGRGVADGRCRDRRSRPGHAAGGVARSRIRNRRLPARRPNSKRRYTSVASLTYRSECGDTGQVRLAWCRAQRRTAHGADARTWSDMEEVRRRDRSGLDREKSLHLGPSREDAGSTPAPLRIFHTVDGVVHPRQPRPLHLPLQHRDLMARHQDLGIPGHFRSGRQSTSRTPTPPRGTPDTAP